MPEESAGVPQAPIPPPPPLAWTPAVGMLLNHKTIRQRVRILERRMFPVGVFWEIIEVSGSLSERPWLIGEANLIEQYIPHVEEKR